MSDVYLLSGISGPSFDSPFPVSSLVFFCLVLLLFLSCHFSADGPFSWLFSRKLKYLLFLCFHVALCPRRRNGVSIRDRDRVGRWRESECSTAETVWKRPERPWTAAITMEVLRRCPLVIAQRLVHCAIAVSTAVLDRIIKTMSVALLLTNNLDNSRQKTSNLLSPAPPPYSWSLLGKFEGPAPPPSKITWSCLEPCIFFIKG